MSYRSYFEIPKIIDKKHYKGSAPLLVDKLLEELQDAKEIYISLFLYNNPHLHYELEKMSNNGCKIVIYSIPLNGYTNKPVKLYENNYNKFFYSSKSEYASKVYLRISNKLSNIELRIFPHTYIWSVQKFSRGKDLYSLHCKSAMAEYPGGIIKCFSASCNFALGDPPHSENILVIENDTNTINMFQDYFSLLFKNSMPLSQYENFSINHYDFEYTVKAADLADRYNTCYFTAPFIKYNGIGSNHYVQQKIIDFMKTAKNRILVCTQHFSDLNSFDSCSGSITEAIAKAANSNNINIKILKQTRPGNQKQGARTKKTEELLSTIKNIEQRYWSSIIHDKFIIADDKLMVCTANLTSTQFAWAEGKEMEYCVIKNEIERNYKAESTFSEINSFHFIDDKSVAEKYFNHFNALWSKACII